MKLGMLYRLKNFFTPEQLLSLYMGHIRPCMEYASHIWSGSSHVSLLDKVEKKAFRLINLPKLTNSIQPLYQRRDVGTLSLFYRYYNGQCSSEISDCVPKPLRRARNTRLATQSHDYSVNLSNARVNRYSQSFMYTAGELWNRLPSSIFPNSFDLKSFKSRVSGHLLSLGF